MVAGSKRRSAENLDVKYLTYITNICLVAENTRDACLVALLYLTGRRIGELIALQKQDIAITALFLSVSTFNEKNFRYTSSKAYNIEKEGSYLEYLQSYDPDTYEKHTITIPRTVRYYQPIRIDISRTTPTYQELGQFVENHLATLQNNQYVFARFKGTGHIGRGLAYKIV